MFAISAAPRALLATGLALAVLSVAAPAIADPYPGPPGDTVGYTWKNYYSDAAEDHIVGQYVTGCGEVVNWGSVTPYWDLTFSPCDGPAPD